MSKNVNKFPILCEWNLLIKLRTPPGKCMLTAGRCACVPAELCTHSA